MDEIAQDAGAPLAPSIIGTRPAQMVPRRKTVNGVEKFMAVESASLGGGSRGLPGYCSPIKRQLNEHRHDLGRTRIRSHGC